MIGKRALDDPRNSLVHHFVRLASELKASYFVFENVRGLTIGEHRKFLEEIMAEFRKNGYRVLDDYQVLNATHYGVPQNRQRLFLMGARKGFPLPKYPDATHEVNAHAGPGSLFRRSTPTVWDALRDIPEADDYEELLHRDWVKAKFKKSTEYSALLRGDEVDPGDYSAPREYDASLLTSSLRTVHTDLSKKRFLLENAPWQYRTRQPLPQTRPEGRLQHDPRGDCQRSRRVHVAAPDTSLFAPLHHGARSRAFALLSGLVPFSRD